MLGLSATVARKDGHHPIIFMQCDPVRYRVDAETQAATRSFSHKVRLRETGFQHRPEVEAQGLAQMTALYAALAQDEKRNDLIFDDVMLSLQTGRRPVISSSASAIEVQESIRQRMTSQIRYCAKPLSR